MHDKYSGTSTTPFFSNKYIRQGNICVHRKYDAAASSPWPQTSPRLHILASFRVGALIRPLCPDLNFNILT